MTEYRRYLNTRVELNHGKGKSVVTGPVTVTFVGGQNALVNTEGAHINDDNPAVEYRGERLLAHLRLVRNAQGAWMAEPGAHQSLTRPNWTDAPPSYLAAVFAAVAAKLGELWNDEVERQASYITAANKAHYLEVEIAKLTAERDDKSRELRNVYRTMRANAPHDVPDTAPTANGRDLERHEAQRENG